MHWFLFVHYVLLILQTTLGQLDRVSEESKIEGRTLFDDDLREIVEFLRLQMPCGFPSVGLPPLVPLHAGYRDVKWVTDDSSIRGNVTEFTITGLNEFDVRELNFNNILRKVTYDFRFPQILLTGSYKADIIVKLFGPALYVYGDGELHLTLKNLRIYGSFILTPRLSGAVRLRKLKATTELGYVESKLTGIMNSQLNTKLTNAWIAQFISLTFNDSQEDVNAALQRCVVPLANQALDEVSVIGVLALIFGILDGSLPQETLC